MDALQTVASLAYAFEASISKSSGAQAAFQWGGTIFDLFLLILNRFGLDSRTESTLLVLYLFISLPEVLFKILRCSANFRVALIAYISIQNKKKPLVNHLAFSIYKLMILICREQFGCWVAFLAIVANMFFPHTSPVPVSRFLLFVIAPNLIAHGLRNSMVGGVFCLAIGIAVVIIEIRGSGGFRNCSCNFRCFAYYLCVAFLFCFTILYLCLGNW